MANQISLLCLTHVTDSNLQVVKHIHTQLVYKYVLKDMLSWKTVKRKLNNCREHEDYL